MVQITLDTRYLVGAGVLLALGLFVIINPLGFAFGGVEESGDVITIYKSQSCGCCGSYSSYLTSLGFKVKTQITSNLNPIKAKYGVPTNLQSCHTSVIGDYFVEGHIPVEAIEKLLAEKPDIAGIALAGMPSGSPGMPGGKTEMWQIYAVGHDGKYSEFMII